MKFRSGLIIGFALGYYLGTKAGRERYRQLNSMLERVRSEPRVAEVTTKAKDLIDQGTEKARSAATDLKNRAADEAGTKVGEIMGEGDRSGQFTDAPDTMPEVDTNITRV
jgi:vacuolar-type H+-ATPase subunit H